jgi:hypothetical protein
MQARDLTFDLDDQPPEQIYVIFRVSDIYNETPGEGPRLRIFVDPHRMLLNGDIRIVSSIEAVGI